ncbi:nuclease-related domain-containing protein [Streptomyces sp. NPDC047868]|uniref:nuclease-related domain-containing protein n=1 Tax=Streptomyces sp. NPDC047868 TaxID=3155480 RepID=UPI0034530209
MNRLMRAVWRRVLAWLNPRPDPRVQARARRQEIGDRGEASTRAMLAPLTSAGWKILHRRALPGSPADLDHVLVSPGGTGVVIVDSKQWHAQRPTWLVQGRVHCGTEDRHGQVEQVASYARRAAERLSLPGDAVWPLVVVHGSPVAGGYLKTMAPGFPGPVWVVSPGQMVAMLLAAGRRYGRDDRAAERLEERVAVVFPPYVRKA